MAPPLRFAHVVYRTNDLPRLRDWYLTTLEASVAFENDLICFITYDEEHHRVAIVNDRRFEPPGRPRAVDHVAYTRRDLRDLIDTHDRLATAGILPYWTVNHGPTTSFYYRDPEGNGIEFQVDNYPDVEQLHQFFRSAHFADNPIGIDVDVDDLRARLDAGEPIASLLLRADVAAGTM
jgi:catechol-2,3-dioxygenase